MCRYTEAVESDEILLTDAHLATICVGVLTAPVRDTTNSVGPYTWRVTKQDSYRVTRWEYTYVSE